jgi:RNA polymerase sigma-70 factor (ECF subfamily)
VNDDAGDLAAARSGDHRAFSRLYRRHAGLVLSVCRCDCGGADADAEDAMQVTFIRAHDRLDRVDDPGALRAWLCGIARRVCSERRRSARRRLVHENGFRGVQRAAARPRERSAPEAAARSEDLDRLTAALRTLDERERTALHLHYLERDPAVAAEAMLGLSRSGYYKLLARARDHLATRMREVQYDSA